MYPDFWSDKRVLVTGHTGFKGSWLCLLLRHLGAEVVGYALKPPTRPSLFDQARIGAEMSSVIADIRDRARLVEAMQVHRPDVVFHLAAQSLVPEGYAQPVETFEVNVLGTVNVLDAVRQTPSTKAVVIVTSDKCYANAELNRGYVEEDPLGGDDPYSNSKGCAELVTASYRTSFLNDIGTGVATARAGNVLGGGDWSSNRLVPDIVRAALGDRRLTLRYPTATRPWQHVLDPLRGYVMLAERLHEQPAEFAEAWNFGPDPAGVRTVGSVVDHLIELFGGGITVDTPPALANKESMTLILDATKARRRLAWAPRFDLDDTLRSIVSWHHRLAEGESARMLCNREIERFVEKSA